jgi:NAD(P)-dependent dehydrogenase (short-subunit alcohol dehydrogenase family)
MKDEKNPFSLEGKKILVTGASSGIGREVAITLSYAGAVLVINGRNEGRLEETLNKLLGNDHIIIAGDLNESSTIDKICNLNIELDGFVNAAGVMKLLPFKFISNGQLEEMMQTNFFSPIGLMLALFKKKKIAKNASIIYITSINGAVVGSKANSMYAASKGALTGMIRAMAIDLAKSNVRVNNIAPGMIETDGAMEIKDIVSKEAIEEDIQKYPLNRYGTPKDVAYACQYFLSDASSWITGTTLVVDGGFTIK